MLHFTIWLIFLYCIRININKCSSKLILLILWIVGVKFTIQLCISNETHWWRHVRFVWNFPRILYTCIHMYTARDFFSTRTGLFIWWIRPGNRAKQTGIEGETVRIVDGENARHLYGFTTKLSLCDVLFWRLGHVISKRNPRAYHEDIFVCICSEMRWCLMCPNCFDKEMRGVAWVFPLGSENSHETRRCASIL